MSMYANIMISIMGVYFIEKLNRASIFSLVGFLFSFTNRLRMGVIMITTKMYHNINSFVSNRLRKPNIIGSKMAKNTVNVLTLIEFFIPNLTTKVCILSFLSALKSLSS